jgi:hypothetical protein
MKYEKAPHRGAFSFSFRALLIGVPFPDPEISGFEAGLAREDARQFNAVARPSAHPPAQGRQALTPLDLTGFR